MTDNPSHDRQRAVTGATAYLLKLLIFLPNHSAEILTAAVAFGCDVNTIHQAAHRLRDKDIPLETLPPAPWGRWTGGATHYRLPEDSIEHAEMLLEAIRPGFF